MRENYANSHHDNNVQVLHLPTGLVVFNTDVHHINVTAGGDPSAPSRRHVMALETNST